jgi:predicted RNA-binding Zn ribbon-like protein
MSGEQRSCANPSCNNAPAGHRKTCSDRCRQIVSRRSRSRPADTLHDRYAAEISAALRNSELDAVEAVTLRISPSERAEAALAVRELVARTLAAFDSGRMDIARRAAGPIARDIFVELEAAGGRRVSVA